MRVEARSQASCIHWLRTAIHEGPIFMTLRQTSVVVQFIRADTPLCHRSVE